MAREFSKVGVVGLGTMGAGIVEVFARNGIDVVAVEVDDAAVEKGRGVLENSTGRAVARGKLTEQDQSALHSRVHFTASMDELADCELVVEAVPEHLELKKDIFGKLDAIVGPDAVLATNTSSLSVTEIAVATSNPKRVVGMHFFNPAPVLQFVEVVRTVVTEDEVFEDVKALAQRLGKQPVIVGDKAGFIANALLFGYLNHAVSMFESKYASREDIDAAMRLGCGYPMGPLALMDLIGLDTAYEILDTMYKQGRDRLHAPSPIIKQMVSAGLKGRKSGRGFYTYAQPGSSQVADDALTPRPAGRVGRDAAQRAHGRRRGFGDHGDRHHRGLRQGRLRRRLRDPQPAQGRCRHRVDPQVAREGRPARQAHRGGPHGRVGPPASARRRWTTSPTSISWSRPSSRTWPSRRRCSRTSTRSAARERSSRRPRPACRSSTVRRPRAARRTSSGCTSSTPPRS